jgi:hypothetical protein
MSELLPDISTILPFGSSLIPLLYSSFLSDANLNQLLRSRGIYNSSNEKDVAVSIIKNIILSPDEFNVLREQQKTKEDKKKNTSEDIIFDSSDTLFDITSDDHFKVNDILEGKQGIIQIEGVSTVNVVDKNHLYYEYNLIRNDTSKDWANSATKHSGRIDFIKKENVISIYSEYTSNETKKVNDEIRKRLKENLKKKSKTGEIKVTKITFDSFSNINRIHFLFSFFDNKEIFSLYKITDISFGPDPQKTLPEQARWMEERVKKLSIVGKDLNKIEYFANKKYYESLLIESIDAQFVFVLDKINYIVKYTYGFPSYFKKEIPDIEFESSIQDITDMDQNRRYNDDLRRTVEKIFSEFKTRKFHELKNYDENE